ncbi:glycerol-3-phosphate dehydrogenase/oxidase [Chryseomicrobium palamuruense]|uniref:Glycerol-3-phosphate dehydrogenase n=1 Tax=Chryseomicrobium palamuruense TaxID=682973 RepID=A0ABV8UYS4_9BACL
MGFSNVDREKHIQQLQSESFDLLVIGGGITGAGIALDAISRGLKVALVEMQDFAAGTSSRSTKLVHGGLRYLKQFEIGIVAEVGKEREIVYENGPHITTPEWMMLPFYKGGTFGPLSTNVGLRVYDFLAGVKKAERRKMLSVEEALTKEPLLKKENLKGAGYYVEYKTDDARLTIEVLKKAVELGALALNYMKVTSFVYEEGKIVGVQLEDRLTHEKFKSYATTVVNAAGPWVDILREEDGSRTEKSLLLTKGVHLVFDHATFPLQQAIYFDTQDGRMIFAIPRDGKTYVGTTDTVYEGDVVHPTLTTDDVNYVLSAINYQFPELHISLEDMESSWSGLRPLIHEDGKSPSEISRKDEVFESESGLLSIAGGKLTGYRKMAEQIVDRVLSIQQKEAVRTQTKHLPLSGGDVGGSKGFPYFKKQKMEQARELGIPEKEAELLIRRYGSNVQNVFKYYQEAPTHSLDPFTSAVLSYAIHEEMIVTPADFFVRRTGALFFHIDWVRAKKEAVLHYLSDTFSWSPEQLAFYKDELELLLEQAVEPVE